MKQDRLSQFQQIIKREGLDASKSQGSSLIRRSRSREDPFDPSIRTNLNDGVLKENMVFSIEPALYFPWGGVRLEDLVLIKNGKVKVLGKVQEEIIEIGV